MKEQRTWLIVTISTVIILIFVFAGITYAFFTANNPAGSTALITNTSGKMTINYADGGNNLLVSDKITPSNIIIVNKTFTLTGVNTASAGTGMRMSYKVGLDYISEFSDDQLHYYIKRTTTNSNVTSTLVGTANQTIPGNTSETGYTHGTLKKGNRYQELATGEFLPNSNSQTITFNLKMQFPDTNTNQDTEKGKSLTGNIVVNYEESMADTLIAKYDTETKTNGVTTSGLFMDNTKDMNIRYTGANPSNYVEFGNTGELWRIVGIFNVKDSEGNTARNIKLVRDSALGGHSWDARLNTQTNDYRGINDWNTATLMKELNGDYLNYNLSSNVNWYNNYWQDNKAYERQTGVFDYTKTIKQKYQDMISTSVWNTGATGPTGAAPYTLNLLTQYDAERGNKLYSGDTNNKVTRTSTWTGKVGLIYASDYGFASTNEECRNNLRAGVTYVNSTWDYSNGICKTDNWLAKTSWYWTMSPCSGDSDGVFIVHGDGAVATRDAYNAHRVFPAVFLKSNILIESGEGTKTNPYKLG